MARKLAANAEADDVLEEFKMVTELRGEMAQVALDAQDEETQGLILRIADKLAESASGYVMVKVGGKLVRVEVESELVKANTLFVATEILKDLALFDIRVGTYVFPPSLCASCGAELLEIKKGKKRG
jgi:hypothetical protein